MYIAMIPGLLPVFLHGCEIKSGSGLGIRLTFHIGLLHLTAQIEYNLLCLSESGLKALKSETERHLRLTEVGCEVGCEGLSSCKCWCSDVEHILCIHHQLCRYSKWHHLSHGCWRVVDRTMSKGFVCSILLDFNSVVGRLEGTDIRRLKTNKKTNDQLTSEHDFQHYRFTNNFSWANFTFYWQQVW